jgi:hypothetical protein
MHLTSLRAAGYIPVKVASLDNVRLMPVPMAAGRTDMILEAAAYGISSSAHAEQHFGRALARALIRDAESSRAVGGENVEDEAV